MKSKEEILRQIQFARKAAWDIMPEQADKYSDRFIFLYTMLQEILELQEETVRLISDQKN